MAEILVVRPKTLNAADKKALRVAGVVVVEANDPTEVRFLRADSELSSGDLCVAAMNALSKSSNINNEHGLFVKLVSAALERRQSERENAGSP